MPTGKDGGGRPLIDMAEATERLKSRNEQTALRQREEAARAVAEITSQKERLLHSDDFKLLKDGQLESVRAETYLAELLTLKKKALARRPLLIAGESRQQLDVDLAEIESRYGQIDDYIKSLDGHPVDGLQISTKSPEQRGRLTSRDVPIEPLSVSFDRLGRMLETDQLAHSESGTNATFKAVQRKEMPADLAAVSWGVRDQNPVSKSASDNDAESLPKIESAAGVATGLLTGSVEQPPLPPEVKQKKRLEATVVAGDFEHTAGLHAEEIGERSLTRRSDKATGFWGTFVDRAFTQNLFREFNVRNATLNKRREILLENNMFAGRKGATVAETRAMHERVVQAVLKRGRANAEAPESDIGAAALRKGEWLRVGGESEAEKSLSLSLEALVSHYAANPDLTEASFNLAKSDVMREYAAAAFAAASDDAKEQDASAYGARGEMIADNIWEQVERLRPLVAHEGGIENVDLDINLALMGARVGAETEIQRTHIDEILKNLENSGGVGERLGVMARLMPKSAVFGALGSASAYALGGLVGLNLPVVAVGAGVALGAVAYQEVIRRAKELQLHERERAEGQAVDRLNPEQMKELAGLYEQRRGYWFKGLKAGRPELRALEDRIAALQGHEVTKEHARRDRVEKFALERASAAGVAGSLRALSGADLDGLSDAARQSWFESASRVLADAEARVRVGDAAERDFFAYSSLETMEEERLQLLVARGELKSRLRAMYVPAPGDGRSYDEYLQATTLEAQDATDARLSDEDRARAFKGIDQLHADIKEKDSSFKKYLHKVNVIQTVFRSTIGYAVSTTFSELLHEAASGLGLSATRGLVDMARGTRQGAATETAMAHVVEWFKGHVEAVPGPMQSVHFGNGVVALPAGAHLTPGGNGTFTYSYEGVTVRGLHPDGSGGFDAASLDALNRAGVPVHAEGLMAGGTHTETVTMPTDQWLKTSDIADSVKHLNPQEHYVLGTPKVYEYTEQYLRWGGEHGTGIGVNPATGKPAFVLDVTDAIKAKVWASVHGGHTLPGVNPLAAAREGHLQVLLFPDKHLSDTAVSISVPVGGPNSGHIFIDMDSALGKFFSVDNGHAVSDSWRMVLAHVDGSTEHLSSGVAENFRSVAMAPGAGMPHVSVEQTIPELVTHTSINPGGARDLDIWPGFIPLYGRAPMERLTPRGLDVGPYGREGSGSSFNPELLRLLETWRSDTLKKNPEAKLDLVKEAGLYFDKLDKVYVAEVKDFADKLPKMGEDVEAVVCIPVAGHQEGGNIYKSLESYVGQTADPKKFEIILFVNWPEMDRSGKKIQPDNTLEQIAKFKGEHPELTVHVIERVMKREDAKISLVRKYVSDVAVMRASERETDKDILVMSNDADNKGMAPTFVENFLTEAGKHPESDGFLGMLDWDVDSYVKYPALHLGTRLFQFLNTEGRANTGRMPSSGANYAVRASMYAAIGGYRPEMEGGGEDIAIGKGLISARNNRWSSQHYAGAGSRVYTSSRRAVDALRSGLAPVEQWDKGFSAFDDEVRKLMDSVGERPNLKDPRVVENLKKQCEIVVNRTLNVYESGEHLGKGHPYYARNLAMLGIRYRLDATGNAVITDWSKFLEGVERYQESGPVLRDIKAGRLSADALKRESAKTSPEDGLVPTEIDVEALDLAAEQAYSEASFWKFMEKLRPQTIQSADTGTVRVFSDVEGVLRVKKSISLNALKVARKQFGRAKNFEVPERAMVEAGISSDSLSLPIGIAEAGRGIERTYEAMDTDLNKAIERGAVFAPKEAIAIIIKVALGVRELHNNGIVHGDIAPQNILLRAADHSVRLGDFDAAQQKGDGVRSEYTRQIPVWNPATSAPELFDTIPRYTQSIDTYALGIILYRLTAGEWPLADQESLGRARKRGDDEKSLLADLAEKSEKGVPADKLTRLNEKLKDYPGLAAAIMDAINPDSRQRTQSLDAFIGDLQEVLSTAK